MNNKLLLLGFLSLVCYSFALVYSAQIEDDCHFLGCGAIALKAAFVRLGVSGDIEDIQNSLPMTADGLCSFDDLVSICNKYKLSASAVNLTYANLNSLPDSIIPILHWTPNNATPHFFTVIGKRPGFLLIVDDFRSRWMPLGQFLSNWDGKALLVSKKAIVLSASAPVATADATPATQAIERELTERLRHQHGITVLQNPMTLMPSGPNGSYTCTFELINETGHTITFGEGAACCGFRLGVSGTQDAEPDASLKVSLTGNNAYNDALRKSVVRIHGADGDFWLDLEARALPKVEWLKAPAAVDLGFIVLGGHASQIVDVGSGSFESIANCSSDSGALTVTPFIQENSGGRVKLRLECDTTNLKPGYWKCSAQILPKDTKLGPATFLVSAVIELPIKSDVKRIVWSNVNKGEAASSQIRISAQPGVVFNVTSIRCVGPQLSITPVNGNHQRSSIGSSPQDFTISWSAGSVGSASGVIIVTTDHPYQKELKIPWYGFCKAPN